MPCDNDISRSGHLGGGAGDATCGRSAAAMPSTGSVRADTPRCFRYVSAPRISEQGGEAVVLAFFCNLVWLCPSVAAELEVQAQMSPFEATWVRGGEGGPLERFPHVAEASTKSAIERRLAQLVSIQIKDVPLDDAMDFVRLEHAVSIIFDKAALKEAGISLDQPLSITVEEAPLHLALGQLLRTCDARLRLIVNDRFVLITAEDRATPR